MGKKNKNKKKDEGDDKGKQPSATNLGQVPSTSGRQGPQQPPPSEGGQQRQQKPSGQQQPTKSDRTGAQPSTQQGQQRSQQKSQQASGSSGQQRSSQHSGQQQPTQKAEPQHQRGPQSGSTGQQQQQTSQQGDQQRQRGPQSGSPGQQLQQGVQQRQQGPQSGPPGQQQQRGPQGSQWGPPGQQQQAGQQRQQGPQSGPPGQQQQRGPQGSQWGPPGQQQQAGQQQRQQGPQSGPPGQQQQRGPQGSQWGPPGQQQQAGQQRQQGPQSGPPGQQQQRGPQGSQWGPPGQQQQAGQQRQQGPQSGPPGQQQQRGPQGSQWGPPGQQQQAFQQQRQQGPQSGPPGQQQQRGPQGSQWGPPGQQQQAAQQRPGSQQSMGSQGQMQQQQQRRQGAGRQQDVQQRFEQMQISSSPSSVAGIMRGTKGTPGIVEANYLRLDLQNMPNVAYHYDVTIVPDRPKKFLRPAFEQFNRQFFKNTSMAYDGIKSFYTATSLEIENEFEANVMLDDSGGRQIQFKVTIKATGNTEIDLGSLRTYHNERVFDKPMRALQCLEVVLASACHNRGIRSGRSFFNKPERMIDLGDGFELYTGLYQAMILGDEPFMNVDISHKSFLQGSPILDYLKNNRNFDPNKALDSRLRYSLIDYLNNLRIVYTPPQCFGAIPREYTVRDVSSESASQKMFTLEDGQKKSVAEYFSGRGYRLRYPNLNCLIVGSTVKTIALPIELCAVKGGQCNNKKDDARQVSNMIKHAATSTNVRKEKIMNLLRRFEHNSSDVLKSFNIRIGNSFIDVPMRLLTAPFVAYALGNTFRVSNGSWRINDNTQYLKPAGEDKKIHKWAVLYHKDSRGVNYGKLKEGLVENFLRGARGHNLKLDPNPLIEAFAQIGPKLDELKKGKYDLVVVVIPFRGATYAEIKQAAELKVGILTQCIKENTVERRCDMMTTNNILLKINAKLNGINHKIDDKSPMQNVMFVGADVTHPSPDQRNIPSVVGVAASHDPFGASYNMQYRLQKSTEENIEDMESIFSHHMNVYKKYNNKYPDHIIYYRDGVSDGQFQKVKQNELRGMRAACQKLAVKPKITCTIVVKRHHTRFFPKTQTRDKFNNVEPGTVVDRVIVHPNEKQFFMVSHQSIQGTAKPTRYNVIEDDANMNIDDLQRLTHNMCHLFPRCNRAVSYPTPVYLAHLVAFRGRVYLEGTQRFGELRREYEKRKINEGFMNTNPMYFV